MIDTMENSKKARISSLFKKYLQDTCAKNEAREILAILEDSGNDIHLREEAESHWGKEDSKDKNHLNPAENRLTMDRILDRLHHRISLHEEELKNNFRRILFDFFSKAAAILILPLLIYTIYLASGTNRSPGSDDNPIAWRTVKTTTGMQTDFYLPDGTHVWLNSGSVLKYPVPFAKGRRQTELMGEAYFDVTKDTLHPFLVNAGKMNIEVKGTRFNVVNYPDETVTELILECGSVRLFSGNYDDHKTISYVKPGEIATLDKSQNQLTINRVEVGKYTAWREGTLIFREDKMDEVVRKLNRWFNVEVILQSPELKEYVYTATYRDETLTQIMELLKISAPIKYRITDRVRLPDNSFSKRRIYITKQN